MPEFQSKILLPPKYYLQNFEYVLGFVERKYGHILNEIEKTFISRFGAAEEDCRCLYVRFSNRAGVYFKTNSLKYEEIESIPYSLSKLIDQNFVEKPDKSWLENIEQVLDIYNKAELISLAKLLKINAKGLNSLSKQEVVYCLMQSVSAHEILEWLQATDEVVKLNFEAEVSMIKYLFFGNRYDTMTEFVTRDLGYQRYEQYDEEKLVAHFANRKEAEDKMAVSLMAEQFYRLANDLPPDDLFHWAVEWFVSNIPKLTDPALTVLERQKVKFAAFFEKNKHIEQAYDMYALTELPPSRERRVRILGKLGYNNEAEILIEQMQGMPYNNDEYYFALDYLRKQEAKKSKTKNKRSVTLQLHDSESITIPISWQYRVEAGVIDYYQQLGYTAVFSENYLWKSLFGLLFWDIIYDTETLAIHHPLQRAPSDIYKPIFFETRREKLMDRLEVVDELNELLEYVQFVFEQKNGFTNPLVDWSATTLQAVLQICKSLSAFQLRTVLLEIATNLKQNTHGFPDLFIWNDTEYYFVEVKSPTDNLSNQQLFWLKFFERIEIKSKVLRVEWS